MSSAPEVCQLDLAAVEACLREILDAQQQAGRVVREALGRAEALAVQAASDPRLASVAGLEGDPRLAPRDWQAQLAGLREDLADQREHSSRLWEDWNEQLRQIRRLVEALGAGNGQTQSRSPFTPCSC